MDNIVQRVCVADYRYRAVRKLTVQKQPWVLRFLDRTAKREAVFFQEGFRRRDDLRIARLIEVETTRVVARTHAQTHQTHVFQRRLFVRVVQVQCLTAFQGVYVVDDRQQRLGHEREAAASRFLVVRHGAGTAERIDRDDDERRRGDQCDAKHGARWMIGRVTKAEL